MTLERRKKLSIAFSVYNTSRAIARRNGDIKQIVMLNKILGRMVKAALSKKFLHNSYEPLTLRLCKKNTQELNYIKALQPTNAVLQLSKTHPAS